MAVNIAKLNAPLHYKFKYDQLNRLLSTDAFDGLNATANQWQNTTALAAYHNELSYDPNGNILTNKRNGEAGNLNMDDMVYHYDTTNHTNKLVFVTDAVSPTLTMDEFYNGTYYTNGAGASIGFWSMEQVYNSNETTAPHEHNHGLGGLRHLEDLNFKKRNSSSKYYTKKPPKIRRLCYF